MNKFFIRTILFAGTFGLVSVFGGNSAHAQDYTPQELFQKVQAANCRLRNDAQPWNMNKNNYKSKIKCHGTWQGDPNFQKQINPDLVELAISIAGPRDVANALRNMGVLQ